MDYLLKQISEDFRVKEISALKFKASGNYIYLKLTKKNRTTLDCIKEIAKALYLPENKIGFAGNKDKTAITEQYISIPISKKENIARIKLENVSLEIAGYGEEPITLGNLVGNSFEIVIRNLDRKDGDLNSIKQIRFVENYFDEQRFGSDNAAIGKHLIKKEFAEAVKLIKEKRVDDHLLKNKTDFVGALKRLQMRLLKIYVNAYQSYLWNESLRLYLERKSKIIKKVSYTLGEFCFTEKPDQKLEVPLIGFNEEIIETVKNKEIKEIISQLRQSEQITFTDFIIKPIPELSQEGELRKAFTEVKDLKVGNWEDDELNKGKNKITLSFSLGKGSYATMVIRKIIG